MRTSKLVFKKERKKENLYVDAVILSHAKKENDIYKVRVTFQREGHLAGKVQIDV